jgi:hypothetical protein
MKKGGSRRKGNAFELHIAKCFTTAFYPDGDGIFRRIPLSGGWDKSLLCGDLMALKGTTGKASTLDARFPFSIECKHHSGMKPLFSSLYCAKSDLFNWMAQAADDSEGHSKIPLVVFRAFRSEDLLCVRNMDYANLVEQFGDYDCQTVQVTLSLAGLVIEEERLRIMKLDEFLEWVDFQHYK